jgi:adenosine deaminase
VTLSTDDMTVSDLTLSQEYENAVSLIGLTMDELWAIDQHALDVAFCDETALEPVRALFTAWSTLRA